MSIQVQIDPAEGSGQTGSSPSGEVPASSAGSASVEVAAEAKPQEDDTAPEKESVPTMVSTSDIAGN